MSRLSKPSKFLPKLDQPRVRKHVENALKWCEEQFIGTKKAFPIAAKKIRAKGAIGNKDQSPTAEYLYANLLQQSGYYEIGKHSYSYSLKMEGYEKIYRLLGMSAPTVIDVVQQRCDPVLRGEKIEYTDRGLRRYHPIQNVKREYRKQVFAGWWDYDIEACAPTLIYQYAVKRHRFVHGDGPEPFPAVARLVNDKAAVRQYVSDLTGLDLQTTKELVNALFFRANSAPREGNRLFYLLDNNPVLRYRLIFDPFIEQLRSEVEAMWKCAVEHNDYERAKLRISEGEKVSAAPKRAAKRRMNIYMSLERRVMDAMLDQLPADSERPFLMHDGFMSRTKVDADMLVTAVRDRTGFDIRLSAVQLGETVELEDKIDVAELMDGDTGEEENEFETAGDGRAAL